MNLEQKLTKKPKIFEFILDNILIIGLITAALLAFFAMVKFMEYRDTKKGKKK